MSTVKKSQATAAWECKNCDQVTSDRSGAGSMPLALRMFHTVDEAIRWPEAGQFAVDAAVAPDRVLGGEAKDESPDLVRGRWASRSSRGMCPVSGDASAVPSQQGVRCDDPACSSWPGESGGDGAEQGPITVVNGGSVDLAE